jgi:hypothetical protein
MGILSDLFGGGNNDSGSNPMNAANQFLNQIPGIGQTYYNPYIGMGFDAAGQNKGQYESMMNDPTGFINKLMEAYKPSEGYNFQKGQLTKEMGNTAAAGGIAGTPLDQMNQAEGIQGLLSKDMQQFLSNSLGVFGRGLSGEEGIASRGFDASKSLADLMGGAANQQGGLAFQNAQQNQSNKNGMLQALAKALGLGVGAFSGGIPGAAAGGSLANNFFGSH